MEEGILDLAVVGPSPDPGGLSRGDLYSLKSARGGKLRVLGGEEKRIGKIQ